MPRSPYTLNGRRLALLLPVLLLRVLIPAGFMPATDSGWGLKICPEGFPQQLLGRGAHHHGRGGGEGSHPEHCTFGSSCAAPLPEFAACAASCAAPPPGTPGGAPIPFCVRLVHLPEPRGPPSV